jgi:hypothetical protein
MRSLILISTLLTLSFATAARSAPPTDSDSKSVTETGFRGPHRQRKTRTTPIVHAPRTLCFPTAITSAWARSIEPVERVTPGSCFCSAACRPDRQVAKPVRFTQFLAKATITQQSARCRGIIGESPKLAKVKARCCLAPQTRCGRLWGKSRPRKRLTRSDTCRGTRGSG